VPPLWLKELSPPSVSASTKEFYHGPKFLGTLCPLPVTRDPVLQCLRIRRVGRRWRAYAGLTFGVSVKSLATVTANRLIGEARAYDILPDGRFIGLIEAGGGAVWKHHPRCSDYDMKG
jgi:hypothetical protein